MKQSQTDFIIEHLKLNGFVSRNFALANYISRLGSIICNLTKDGWEFSGEYIKEKNGRNFRYTVIKSPLRIQTFTTPDGKEIKIYK